MLASVRVLHELGARDPGTYLGELDGTKLVLETYANLDDRVMQRVTTSARHLQGVKHPHLVLVLSVERIGVATSVVTEHVDGVPLEDVFFGMSLGARLRAVVDVLTALSALHVPMAQGGVPIVHAGLLRRSSFVEKSGRTKLGFAYRGAMCIGKDSYAPEALLADDAAIGVRTDVYGAGVLLWEAVTGRALFGDDAPDAIVKKQLRGRIDRALPAAHDRWARSILPVIDRALATDPQQRYTTIAEMAAALRIAVRARLMFHEDIIEELWPARTVPKVASGIQPTAPAAASIAESETRVVAARAPDVAPVDVPAIPVRITSPLAPPPSRVPFVLVAGVVGLVVVVVAIAWTLHHRHLSEASAAAPMPAVTQNVVGALVETALGNGLSEPSPAVSSSSSESRAAPSPADGARIEPHKGVKRPPKPPGTYDPSSI